MWKKTRIFGFLFVLFVFSVRTFSSSGTKPPGALLTYEKLYPKLMASTAEKPSPAIPPRGTPPLEPEPLFPRVTPTPMPEEVKGVYVTGWVAGTPSLFKRLLQFIDKTPVNSLVIDIKDDTGKVSYRSAVPMVNILEAWENKIPNVQNMLKTLQQKKVYPIARLVVFKDPYLAEKSPELALKQLNGEVWRDYKGMAWVDPHAREVWDYNIQIAKEAVKMGFPEIQFDYVRFASDGDLRNCVYPYADGTSKEDVIRDFLLYAREELEPLGAVVSADVFGLACSAPDDLFIGQKLEKIAEAVPVISPMVYPSHYAKGCYGLSNPDLRPYETVFRSLQDARQRLKNYPVKLRPWLQDFSLGSTYGPAQIQAQIQAAYDAGVREWLFWNPSCRYNVDKYVPQKDHGPEVISDKHSREEGFSPAEQEAPPPAALELDPEEEAVGYTGKADGVDLADEMDGVEHGESPMLPPVVLSLTAEGEEKEEEALALPVERNGEERTEAEEIGEGIDPNWGEEAEATQDPPVETWGAAFGKNTTGTDPEAGDHIERMDLEGPSLEEVEEKDVAEEDDPAG